VRLPPRARLPRPRRPRAPSERGPASHAHAAAVSLFRRGGGKADWLVVGLGNPGDRYARTRHNVGFEVAKEFAARRGLPRFRNKYGGLYTEGRRVAVLLPQTYMNESGNSVGPARGALGVDLDHVVAIHDEIDLPVGRIEVRTGGGLAGHNGLKSMKRGLGSGDFVRVRVGVGRPESTDPEVVSRYVLGRFAENPGEVRGLVERAVEEIERRVDSE
jgi:PTH1 family peptidyl-tRNA hydrolase